MTRYRGFGIEPISLWAVLFMLGVMTAAMQVSALTPPPGKAVTVTNGDFEQGTINWRGGGAISTTEHHAGSKSLLLEKGYAYQPPAKKQLIPIDAAHDYLVTVWIKTDGVGENGASLTAAARGRPQADDAEWLGGWIKGAAPLFIHDNGASPAILATGGTHDWQKFEAGIPAEQIHKNAHWLSIYLRHDANKTPQGKAWFDDLAVEQLPKGTIKVQPPKVGITNGRFEQGRQNWGGRGGKVIEDKSVTGGHALKLTSGFAFQRISLEGGKHYRITMRVKSESAPADSGYVQLSYRGRGLGAGWAGPVQVKVGSHTEAGLFTTGGSHDWKTFSAVVGAPNRADTLFLYLRKTSTPGAVEYADVKIGPTDDAVTPPEQLRTAGMAPAVAMLADTDFARPSLVNADFEQGEADWLTQGVVQVSDTAAGQGHKSLRMVNGQAVQGLKVKAGKNYQVSIKIKTLAAAPQSASVLLEFRGPHTLPRRNSAARPIVTGGTHGWQTLTGVVAVPHGATNMLIHLDKSVDDGMAWFDDLSVTRTDKPAVSPETQKEAALAKLLPLPAAGSNTQAAKAEWDRITQTFKGQASANAFTLAQDGKRRYTIFVGSADHAIELQAAKELADYLGRITGADFTPLASDANPLPWVKAGGPLIIVGRHNKLTDKLCPNIPYDKLGEDGFVIRTAEDNIIITGANDRGTLYGVYWFLDHKLGVKWYSPAYTFVPHHTAITLDHKDIANVQQTPRFIYREIFNRDTDDPAWRQHNLLNGRSHQRINMHTAPGIATWSNYWPSLGLNFDQLADHRRNGKTHPQWFAGGQLALMNPRLRQFVAQSLTERLQKRAAKGQAPAVSIDHMDRGWAPDPASKAFAKAHGDTLAAPYLDFINTVTAEIRKTVPKVRTGMQAYHWSFPPPTGMSVRDDVLITVAPIQADFAKAYDAPGNEPIAQGIIDWTKLTPNIVIWDYMTDFSNYLLPYPDYDALCQTIQWLAKYPSIKGYFGQGSYTSLGGEFAELRAWVGGRLLWNPQQDYKALIHRFVSGYYGAAGPQIQQYIDLMLDSVAKTHSKLTIRSQVTSAYLSFDVMRQADELFDQAQAAVTDKPGFLRRVETARIGVDYVILARRADYQRQAKKEGGNWQPDTEQRMARLKTNVAAAGAQRYGEGVGNVTAMFQSLAVNRKVPPIPRVAKGLHAADWRDYQDLDLRQYAGIITEDPNASDGGALRLPGNRAVWGVQMHLDSLPPDGNWKLYVNVRVDPNPDASQDAKALDVGVHPGPTLAIRVSQVADGQYHMFQVPGTYHHDPGAALWFSPPNSNAIKYLYVDRVVAVRAR